MRPHLGGEDPQLHPGRRPDRRRRGGARSAPGSAPVTPSGWTRPTRSSCRASSTRTVMPGRRCSATSVSSTRAAESPVPAEVADHYQPEDVYAATLIGLLGAAEAGITTVVDWSPIRSDAGFAEAALQAHADAGLRTVFVHAARADGGRTPDPRSASSSHGSPARPGRRPASPSGSTCPGRPISTRSPRRGRLARELGMRIHAHAGSRSSGRGVIADLARARAPGRGRHARALRRSSTTRTSMPSRRPARRCRWRPTNEMASDLGSLPIVQQLIDRDIRPGLGDRRRMRDAGRHVRADAGDDLDAARHRLRSQAGREGRRSPTDEHARRDPLRHDRRRAGRGLGRRDRIPRTRACTPT